MVGMRCFPFLSQPIFKGKMLVSVPCTPFIYSIFPKYQLNIQLTQQRAKQKHGHRRDHRWSPFVFSWKWTKVLHQNGRAVLLTNQVDLNWLNYSDLTPAGWEGVSPKANLLSKGVCVPKIYQNIPWFFPFFCWMPKHLYLLTASRTLKYVHPLDVFIR